MQQSPLPRFKQPETVNIHDSFGGRLIEVTIESWLSYYGITEIKATKSLIPDIVLTIDTYGPLIGTAGGYGVIPTFIDAELVEKVIGEMVLARAIALGDKNAITRLKDICSSLVDAEPLNKIEHIDRDFLVAEAVKQVRDTLSSEAYEFLEPPFVIADVARVTLYEIAAKLVEETGAKLPTVIEAAIKEKIDAYQDLWRACQRLLIIEDRIWHLLNTSSYCTCIKSTLLTLNKNQLILLALRYYRNEPVPDRDMLEAMADTGEQYTRRGTSVSESNIDRNINYVLRDVLPKRLAGEFARSIDCLAHTGRAKQPFHPRLQPYLVDQNNSVAQADVNKLREFCQTNIGIRKGALMSEAAIELCRILNKKSSEIENTNA